MAIVKCRYCGIQFDREKEEAEEITNRHWMHAECAKKYKASKTQDELDYEQLENYIKKLFKTPYVSAKIKKQISNYRAEYNYTYTGILKTLEWWFEIRGSNIQKANDGIGIVPYVYQEAHDYYYTLWLAQTANKLQDIQNYEIKAQKIEIPPPIPLKREIKLFNLDKIEEGVNGK